MDELLRVLPKVVSWVIGGLHSSEKEKITEINLKKQAPCSVFIDNERFFIANDKLTKNFDESVILRDNDLSDFFERICESSVYSYEEQIKNGFITLKSGHRIGICGTSVFKNGEISGIRDIGGFVIRVLREITGCGEEAVKLIEKDGKIFNTLIISPPEGGKTTLLRDIARIFSEKGKRVCVIDERSEIIASKEGVSSYKNLRLCDFLDATPKSIGILQAVRTLSPEIIIFDEIGFAEEANSVLYAMNSGASFVFSSHGSDIRTVFFRPAIKKLTENNAIDLMISLKSKKINEIKYINGAEKDENNGFDNNSLHMRFYRNV